MGWKPEIAHRGDERVYRVGATDAESALDGRTCPLSLALKVRPKTIAETGDWVHRKGPFVLGRLADAIKQVGWRANRGGDLTQAIEQQKRTFSDQHDGVRRFLEDALDHYFEYHEAREEQLGRLILVDGWLSIEKKPGAQLAVWGLLYETAAGDREIRRLRFSEPRTDLTPWAYVAAHVAAEYPGPRPAQRVWVTEVGLGRGIERHLLDGIRPEEAKALYLAHGREAALTAIRGVLPLPGHDCTSCKLTGACKALIPVPGFLQTSKASPWTRSVSASDLEVYERCPSRWYMERDAKLPRTTEDSEFLLRGQAVHRWLAAAHARMTVCTADELPETPGATPIIGMEILGPGDYELARPYLQSHLATCPLHNDAMEPVIAERTLYAFDADANVVIATKADSIWLRGGTLVLRETKTTHEALDNATAEDLFSRYLAVAWGLVAMDTGLLQHFNATRGEVQLEVLTPGQGRIYTYATDDPGIMKMARGRIRRLGGTWHTDDEWHPKPNVGCQTCSVRQWCQARDQWAQSTPLSTAANTAAQ